MKFSRAVPTVSETPPSAAPAPAPVRRSPEREGLQLAISRRDKLKHELGRVTQECESFWEKRVNARKTIEAAEAAVEEAKTNSAHYLIQASLGNSATPPLSPKEARAGLADAQDNLAILLETEATIREGMGRQLTMRDDQVREARDAVVRSEAATQALLERYAIVSAEFFASRAVLDHLARFHMLPSGKRFNSFVENVIELPAGSPWRAAFAALETDADAQLPT